MLTSGSIKIQGLLKKDARSVSFCSCAEEGNFMECGVDIVVPVYNGEKTISSCLDSLMELDFPKDKLEIIVVDNSSTDATKEIIKSYPVKYVFENKRCPGAARNKGIKESTSELIAFIDADCVADRLWLKNIIKGFMNEVIGGCGGKILTHNPKTLIEKYYTSREAISQEKGLIYLFRLAGSNAIFRRKVLQEVGLFDDSFVANEDIDLSWRILLKGHQLNYVPEAIVYHSHLMGIKGFLEQWFEYGYGASYLLKKYTDFAKRAFEERTSFSLLLPSLKNFFQGLFYYKDINKIFTLLDIIKNMAYFLGRIYALVLIRLGIKKISPHSRLDNRLFCRIVNDKMIISDLNRDAHYILNEIGTKMFLFFLEGKAITEIIDILTTQYQANRDEIESDLLSFIAEFKSQGWDYALVEKI